MLLFFQFTDQGFRSSQSHGRIVPMLCSYSSNLQTRNLDLVNHMIRLILRYALICTIYRIGIQIQPITWSDCSYAILLFVQFTDQEFRSSQLHGLIVPTLCAYSFNLRTRDLELAKQMVGFFLRYALIHPIYRLGILIQPITWSNFSYAMLLFIQFTDLGFRSSQLHGQIVPTLYSYLFFLYRLGVQIQPFTWLDCSYTVLLFIQFTEQAFRSNQSHGRIVLMLCSYSSNLKTRNLDLANYMVGLFLR